jgi:hypothetical protein
MKPLTQLLNGSPTMTGGLGLAEATNIRTSSAYRAIKDRGGLMDVREGLNEYIF